MAGGGAASACVFFFFFFTFTHLPFLSLRSFLHFFLCSSRSTRDN